MKCVCRLPFVLMLAFCLSRAGAIALAESKQDDPEKTALPTPAELLELARPTMLPLDYTIEKDEIVTSDTDPSMKLRRIEVKFYSQELEGRKWGHPSVIFMPADPKVYNSKERRGKIVVVAQRSWDGLATGPWRGGFLGNYGEPIAARTGYPVIICPIPGEYDGEDGRELSIGFLGRRYGETKNLADSGYVRLAIPYLYAMDVMARILDIDKKEIRAVIGGHSKRVSAYTAAAMDPERVVGVVYMGNESGWGRSDGTSPFRAIEPPHTQQWVKANVLYLGGTNEDGYEMFSINRMQERMGGKWTIEMVPNYRHASMSEKHFLD
ncbi:MAG TPA: hypothetical protein DD670_12550, partial [Planctomycetaceae bacterium]|nr:hypothetical protein [Planctomycetaceae bacterium]